MGSEAAREQMVKGRKKLTSWFGFGSKYEDAAEMFSKAANLFKVAKNCALPARESVAKLHAHPPARATGDEAAEAFYEIAQCHLKLNSAHEAAEAYKDAAVCYKKTNLGRAIEHYKEAVQIHIDTGKFTTAAKLQKEIADGKKMPRWKNRSTRGCLLYTSPSPRDKRQSRMPSSA